MLRRPAAAAAAILALALASGSPAAAQERTIYSSLPLSADAAEGGQSKWVLRGQRLALAQAGGRAGGLPVRLVSLDDATPQAGSWTPEDTAANARRAARDRSAIAYLGEFHSGATAVSLPILNEAGIPQVSPANTAIGLTRRGPGAYGFEPGRYYPAAVPTFARVVPADHLQGAAIARLAQELGVRSAYLVGLGEPYSTGVTAYARRGLRARGIRLAGQARLTGPARNRRSIAARVRRSRAGALIFAGYDIGSPADLLDDVHRARPAMPLIGSDGVADGDLLAGVSRAARRKLRVMGPTLAPAAYPAAAQPVLQALRARHGEEPDPYALHGYEAMSLVLDAMNRAGPEAGDRGAVLEQIRRTENRDSVLGRYSIDRNGDATLRTYGVYRVGSGGALEFERAVDSAAR